MTDPKPKPPRAADAQSAVRLPADLVRRARLRAAGRGETAGEYIARALRERLERDEGRNA